MDSAEARDLDQSRHQALAALLASIASKSAENPERAPLTPERVQRIANTLSDILGDAESAGLTTTEEGKLLNEDGEPVIEISEPLPDVSPSPSLPAIVATASLSRGRLPKALLSPEAIARRQRERDAILDALEAEEAEEERKAGSSHRLTNPKAKLPAQKKDYVYHAKKPSSSLTSASSPAPLSTPPAASQTPSPNSKVPPHVASTTPSPPIASPSTTTDSTKKKSVSFSPDTRPESPDHHAVEWGDVVPARLRNASSQPASLRAIRMDVIERKLGELNPVPASTSMRVPRLRAAEVDSDDEASADDEDDRTEDGSEDPGDESEFDEGVDMDDAMLQREIAFEYYKRKDALSTAMASSELTTAKPEPVKDLDDWDQENVPLEASLASKPGKSAGSRFKKERTYKPEVPANPLIAKAIRHGKIEDGNLVASQDDPHLSDEDEYDRLGAEGKQIIAALRGGDSEDVIDPSMLVNIGPPPTGSAAITSLGSSSQPAPPITTSSPAPTPIPAPGVARSRATGAPASKSIPAPKSRVSRFKQEHVAQPQPQPQSTPPLRANTLASSPSLTRPLKRPSSQTLSSSANPASRASSTSLPQETTRSLNTFLEPFSSGTGFTSQVLTPDEATRPPANVAPTTSKSVPQRGVVMGRQVTESSNRGDSDGVVEERQGKSGRISRFKSERM